MSGKIITDIEGTEYVVEVVEKANAKDRFLNDEDISTKDNNATKVEGVNRSVVAVEPAHKDASWMPHEMRSIRESNWEIVDAEPGDYGPRLFLSDR